MREDSKRDVLETIVENFAFDVRQARARELRKVGVVTVIPDGDETDDKWIIVGDPRRLVKKFSFENSVMLKYFLSIMIDMFEEHSKEHSIVLKNHAVLVKLYTSQIDDVTDIDNQFAEKIDDVYVDALNVL